MKMTDRGRIAALLLAAMTDQNLTQQALHEKSGVAQSTISDLLNQKRRRRQSVRTIRTLRALAGALGQQPTYFERTVRPSTFGRAVRQARLDQNLTLEDLSAQVNIPFPYLSQLEREKLPTRWFKPGWKPILVQHLQMDPAWLSTVAFSSDPDQPPASIEDEGDDDGEQPQ